MKTVYLKDGTEVKLDGVDARERVAAGLASYDPPGQQPQAPAGPKAIADMTVAELKAELTERKVPFKGNDSKHELGAALAAARAADPAPPGQQPQAPAGPTA